MILKLTSGSGKRVRVNSLNIYSYEDAIDENNQVKGTFIIAVDSQIEPLLVKETVEELDALLG